MDEATLASKTPATTSIRLEAAILERTDQLVERLSKQEAYQGLHLTRHEVLRMAILRGLATLEATGPSPGERSPEPSGG